MWGGDSGSQPHGHTSAAGRERLNVQMIEICGAARVTSCPVETRDRNEGWKNVNISLLLKFFGGLRGKRYTSGGKELT